MKSTNPPPPDSSRLWIWLAGLVVLCGLMVAILSFLRSGPPPPTVVSTNPTDSSPPMAATHSVRASRAYGSRTGFAATPARPAEEVVAEKLAQFASHHEQLVAAMAKQFNVIVPPDVDRFLAAVSVGNWPETTNLFTALRQLRQSTNSPPGLEKLWPAISEAYGVAEQAHLWPAQQLLDYGHAVLDSLRPGMIYVGGNDAGRYIPTLLADTSEGESHIVLTQNALADGSYLDYVRYRYGDQFNVLSAADSQNAFQTYLADAQKRLQHDHDFPNEPKQIRPGEDIRVTGGRVQVSGQVAVMSINELLLQNLLQKNPDLSFALEESFPLKSFYGEASTLGPITELRATDSASAVTPERAAQAIDYWRDITQTVLAGTDATSAPRDAYAKMILGQANLFADRNLSGEAEQAFQLATSLSPGNPEGVFDYVKLLTDQKRYDEARQLVQTAIAAAPDNQQFRDVLTSLGRMK